MSLQVWLPLTKDLRQQGLSDVEVTNNGAVFNSAGKLGGCYNFGTGASSLSLPKSFFTSFTGDFSITCWIKIITWNSSYATIWAATSTSASWQNIMAGLFRNGSNSKILFCIGNDSSSTQSSCITTEDIQLNTWYHFACTYTSGKIRLYQNGELVSSYNTSIVPKFSSTQYFNIGKMRENTYQTNSSINDFRIYDHCLSPMEVKELSKGLVLHYPLNRGGWGQENLAIKTGIRTPDQTSQVEWVGFKIGNLPITTGETITVSFDLKMEIGTAITNNTPYLYIYNTNYRGPHGQWISFVNNSSHPFIPIGNYAVGDIFEQRVHFTTTVANSFNPGSQTEDWIEFYSNYDTENKITINNLKIERGAKATSWCPNLADFTYSTLGLNSNIEYDITGFCNNGTKIGTFTYSSDTSKYTVSTYIPTSSYITHACCLDNSNQEWTCCAWVKLDDTVGSQNLNDFNYSNRIVHAANGTPLLYLNAGDNDYYMYGSQKVNANEWTHIAFVFKNSTELRNIYVNGVLTNNYGPNKTSTPSGIPATVKVGGSNFAGYMSDYREYATALSASDIKALYNARNL